MAAFDAATPNPIQEPNWLGWPKPTSTPEPNKSGEILGKMVGTAIEKTGEIGGEVVGGIAESGAQDILRGQIDSLSNTQTLLQTQDPNAPPQDVQKARQVAETLGSAKANGAISPTYYYGQLDKYASDLRSKFPMFNKQIDKGIAEATGIHNTANELYQSTLRDLNSFLIKKDDYEKAAQNSLVEMTRKGVPGAALQLQRLKSGGINPDQAHDWVEKSNNHDYEVKQGKEDLELQDKQGTNTSKGAERLAYSDLFTKAATMRNSIAQTLGYKDWGEILNGINNPEKVDLVQAQQFQNAHISVQSQMRTFLTNEMLKPMTDRKGNIIGPSYAERMPDKWEGVVNNLMKPMEAQTTMFANKDYAPAAALARLDDAAKGKMQHYFNGTRLGSATMAIDILKKSGADKFATDLLQDQLKNGLTDDVKQFGVVATATSWMTPGQVAQMGPGVQQHGMQEDVNDYIKKYGATNGINMFVDDLSNIQRQDIPDANKIAKIKYALGPTNLGVLSSWQRMGLGPSDLKPTTNGADRWNILSQILSPQNLQEIKKLDEKYPTEKLMDTVSSTASTMIRDELGKSVRDLNQMSNPNFQVTYHSDKDIHRFDIALKPGVQATDVSFSPTSLTSSKNMVEKINLGINRIVDIAKAKGRDPDVFIYQYFKDMGYDFSEKQPGTTGQGMMNALSSTYAAERDALKKGREKLLEQGKRQ